MQNELFSSWSYKKFYDQEKELRLILIKHKTVKQKTFKNEQLRW